MDRGWDLRWFLLSIALFRLRFHFLSQKTVFLAIIGGSFRRHYSNSIWFFFSYIFYFLSAQDFNLFFASPLKAILLLASFSIIAGLLVYALLFLCMKHYLIVKNYLFPVGRFLSMIPLFQLKNISSVYQLLISFFLTFFYGFSFSCCYKGFIVRLCTTYSCICDRHDNCSGALSVDFSFYFTMLWSIGFIAGHLITVPYWQ